MRIVAANAALIDVQPACQNRVARAQPPALISTIERSVTNRRALSTSSGEAHELEDYERRCAAVRAGSIGIGIVRLRHAARAEGRCRVVEHRHA